MTPFPSQHVHIHTEIQITELSSDNSSWGWSFQELRLEIKNCYMQVSHSFSWFLKLGTINILGCIIVIFTRVVLCVVRLTSSLNFIC